MDKRIRKPATAHKSEQIPLGELIHRHVRLAIETAVHEELRAALGTNPYERTEVRRGYRNGSKARTADRTNGADRALRAPRHPLQWREGMDVGDRPALSAADAGGQ